MNSRKSLPPITALFARGEPVVLIDDCGPQGAAGAALIYPAAWATASIVNRLLTLSPGLLTVAISRERRLAFKLPSMTYRRPALSNVPTQSFTVSVEARLGVSTGISAADRATTIALLGAIHPESSTLVQPGHIFPLEVATGGSLERSAIAEGAVDLASINGATDSAIVLELLNESGESVSANDAETFAEKATLDSVSLSAVIRHRLSTDTLVERMTETVLPIDVGSSFRAIGYRSILDGSEHVALVLGDPQGSSDPILTRVQNERWWSDVFEDRQHPSAIKACLAEIQEAGRGILLYLRGRDPAVERNEGTRLMRSYGIGAAILRDLGACSLSLISGSQKQLAGLEVFGLRVENQIALESLLERRSKVRMDAA